MKEHRYEERAILGNCLSSQEENGTRDLRDFGIPKNSKTLVHRFTRRFVYALNYNAICAVVFTRDVNLRSQSRVNVVTSETQEVVKRRKSLVVFPRRSNDFV